MAPDHADLDLLRCLLALQLDFVELDSLKAGIESLRTRPAVDLFDHLVERGDLDRTTADLLVVLAEEHIRGHQGDLSLSLEAAALSREQFSAACELADFLPPILRELEVATVPGTQDGSIKKKSVGDDHATLFKSPVDGHSTWPASDQPSRAPSNLGEETTSLAGTIPSTQSDQDPFSTLVASFGDAGLITESIPVGEFSSEAATMNGGIDPATQSGGGGGNPRAMLPITEMAEDAYRTVVAPASRSTEATRRAGERLDPFATHAVSPGPSAAAKTEGTGPTRILPVGEPQPELPPKRANHESRFKIIRRHARGGLGEVYLARDEELNRDVALKEIQDRHADHLSSRSRFLLEAEITGRLEHPGIVPVYGLGTYGDGRPYYAMRFITGESLGSAIDRFHDPEAARRSPGERELELRDLLGRFVATCNAVAYAHSRGVIHRDLKPANIMLGKFGETLVVDWGLAKTIGKGDESASTQISPGEGLLTVRSGAGSQETMAGWAVGTPQYMSPEQARGDVSLMGPACDIYSLGATLYVLLTGKAPFDAPDSIRVIERVKEGSFAPPKSIEASVPLPLNAICLRAMALVPADRHASASTLAQDVEHWLADEPISCYAEPWYRRMARWTRRHRGATAAAALVATTLVASLAIGNVLISRERDRATRNFRVAHLAVDRMLTRLGQSELADVPQMEQVRKNLLDDAVRLYIELARHRPDDRVSQAEVGIASIRLGEIRAMLSELSASERDHRSGLKILEPLAAALPEDPTLQRSLAQGYHGLGVVLRKLNRFPEGETVMLKALRLREGLVNNQLGNPEDRAALADTRYQLGALMARLTGRHVEALPTYEKSIRELRDLVETNRDRPELKLDLARNLNNLGMLQAKMDLKAALTTFEESITLLKGLEREAPGQASIRWRLARAYGNVAYTSTSLGRTTEATAALAQAYERFERLSTEYPTVVDYRNELAGILTDRAAVHQDEGRMEESDDDLRRSLKLREDLVKQAPELVDYLRRLAFVRFALARHLQLKANYAEALTYIRVGLEEIRLLVQRYPDVVEYHTDLASFLSCSGEILLELRDYGGATRSFRRAIEERRYVLNSDPGEKRIANELLVDLAQLAAAYLGRGDHASAATTADEMAALTPADPEEQRRAGRFLARCVIVSGVDPQGLSPKEVIELKTGYGDRAIVHLRKAVALGFRDPEEFQHPDYDEIRDRDDFRKLVGSIPVKAAGAREKHRRPSTPSTPDAHQVAQR
jgi:tetratricopeptide (TPR) repeat protein/tRNA A-37 threonylcarbamoyl transferase component Bud32